MASHGGGKKGFFGKIFSTLSHHGAHEFGTYLTKWGVETIAFTPPLLLLLIVSAYAVDPASLYAVTTAIAALSPLWLPLFLGRYFWIMWMHYIRFIFLFAPPQRQVLLEIQLPAEVTKSPQAMEVFLTALHNSSGEATFIARIWKGQFRATWSLEIACNEGRIGFYIRLRESQRNVTEARLYGQYPEAKIIEVEDYVDRVPYNTEEYNLFGTEFKKTSEPQALPIKTYPDFKLDMNTDTPEIQVDPITHILELFNTVGPGEFMWLQIIMKARKQDEWYGFYTKANTWADPAKAKIKELMAGAAKRAQDVLKQSEVVEGKMNALLTDTEKKTVESIEKQLNRLVFECGIRAIYVGKKDKFTGAKIPSLVNVFHAVRTAQQGIGVTRGLVPYNYPWQDYKEILKNRERRKQFFFYKHRAYFYVPYDQVPVFMTPEELATIWHFPSSVVKTPSLNRVESRRAEAPANLPLGPQL